MSLRDELHRAIDQTPDHLLTKVIDFVQSVRDLPPKDLHSIDPNLSPEEKLRAFEAWAGHLTLPPLPDAAFDRENLY